ncbi:MAG: hypothetical protein AAFU68_02950 [Pseudomonadota bacterium]
MTETLEDFARRLFETMDKHRAEERRRLAEVLGIDDAPDPNLAEALRLLKTLEREAHIFVVTGGDVGRNALTAALTKTRAFLAKMEGE